jgi:hypothetical protein
MQAPDPRREEKTGFNGYRKAGVDTMLIVPRASTHLEYTDINFALPASRYGQDVSSYYLQAWLDKYLKHDPSADGRLLSPPNQLSGARRRRSVAAGRAQSRRQAELLLLLGLRLPHRRRAAARKHRHRRRGRLLTRVSVF